MSKLFKENKNLGPCEAKNWLSLLQKPGQRPYTQNHQENDGNHEPPVQEITLPPPLQDTTPPPPLQEMTPPPPLQARKTRSGRAYVAQPAVKMHPSILKVTRDPKIPFLTCLKGMSKFQLWANSRAAKDHNKLTGTPVHQHIFNDLNYLTFNTKPVLFEASAKHTASRVKFNPCVSSLTFSYVDPKLHIIENSNCSNPSLEKKINALFIDFRFVSLDFSLREILIHGDI